ncbi:LolA family protein [Alterisphingorhabdus coralli]
MEKLIDRHRYALPLLGLVAALAILVGMAGIAISFAGTAHAQSANSGAADLQKIERHLRDINTLTANFVQTDRSNQQLSGKLMLKQPGRIRFEYQKDAELLVVADGRALTLIDYQVNQVQRWPIKESPLGALLDPKRDITRYGRLLETGNSDVLSVEVKDTDRPEYGTITMVFRRDASAPEGIELAGWVALDSQNKRTTISLSEHRYNRPIADSVFKWRDPRKSR